MRLRRARHRRSVAAAGVAARHSRFRCSATPLATTAITGLGAGEQLIGLDSDSGAGRALYGISNTGQAYVVNGFTGVATPLGAPLAFTNGIASTVFRFNPTSGAIRVATDAEQNLRLNAVNGAAIEAA